MINIKVTDLEQKNISVKKDSEITFQNKIYRKVQVLSKREEEKISQIAEEYSDNKLEVLLVEHKVFFSVWVENPTENTPETVENQQSVKKIIKQYRGISYEVEVPDNDHQDTSTSAETRKYRGKPY